MTFTTLISTNELEQRLRDPHIVLLDARFSLDDGLPRLAPEKFATAIDGRWRGRAR